MGLDGNLKPMASTTLRSGSIVYPGDDYLVGMWWKDLPNHLLRYMEVPFVNLKVMCGSDYRAPTWSWASVDGSVISYHITRFKGERMLVQVMHATTQNAIDDVFGQCKGASIRLRGPMRPVRLLWLPEQEVYRLNLPDEDLTETLAYPDHFDLPTTPEVYCLPVHAFEPHDD